MSSEIKAALVIDNNNGYDETTSVQVIDLIGIQPLDDNTYIIITDKFKNTVLTNGAGKFLSKETLEKLIQNIH